MPMDSLHTLIVFLMFASALLVGVAQKFCIPYPIALVFGGTAIGFIPGLKAIYFDPHLILAIVLPPILYNAAFVIYSGNSNSIGKIFFHLLWD